MHRQRNDLMPARIRDPGVPDRAGPWRRWRIVVAGGLVASLLTIGPGLCGCGANAADVAAQTVSTGATTVFDLWITQWVNSVVDTFEPEPADAEEGEVNGGGDGAPGGDGGGTSDGAALFADRCAGCHGADGSGPPDVRGVSADEIAAKLGTGAHAAISLSKNEVVGIAAFLGS